MSCLLSSPLTIKDLDIALAQSLGLNTHEFSTLLHAKAEFYAQGITNKNNDGNPF